MTRGAINAARHWLMAVIWLVAASARASNLVTLHSFSGPDGAGPAAPLFYHEGVLYGTSVSGGANGATSNCPGNNCGVLFAFTLANGTEQVLHSFSDGPGDGAYPKAPLIFDHGLLLGTTEGGGRFGQGTVFFLDPASDKMATLHNFRGGTDGGNPTAGLTKLNRFYFSTTTLGDGTIFQARALGPHEETLFDFNGTDGYDPLSGLTPYYGKLIGTAYEGGAGGAGNVFEFDPVTQNQTILYAFSGGADGGNPAGGVIMVDGQLFGTTYRGGASACACGTIFRLDPKSGTETVLYSFSGGHDGAYPQSTLVAASNAVYGTTRGAQSGCNGAGCGTLFRLDLKKEVFATLHEFTGGADGGLPLAGLIIHQKTLYGTTSLGGGSGCGGSGCGTIFALGS
ncbi:MAG: hypothetical protein POG24_07345 [Acidocella sp.]|nr:hypothetical protein [Acidocella sp.]